MHKRRYTIIYAVTMGLLLTFALLFRSNDMIWMIMAIIALFMTSIYTYSTRKK
ncbi:MAG: hypothetical protein UMR38_00355 [Candidatus Izemoplasma sp.]|nr:hypothetical protein [Candidatus Izemoplasma sp.]